MAAKPLSPSAAGTVVISWPSAEFMAYAQGQNSQAK